MTPDPILQQLYIIRAQVDLLVKSLELREPAEPGEPVACEHPEDKRRQAHNMFEEPAYLCLACGETIKGLA